MNPDSPAFLAGRAAGRLAAEQHPMSPGLARELAQLLKARDAAPAPAPKTKYNERLVRQALRRLRDNPETQDEYADDLYTFMLSEGDDPIDRDLFDRAFQLLMDAV